MRYVLAGVVVVFFAYAVHSMVSSVERTNAAVDSMTQRAMAGRF